MKKGYFLVTSTALISGFSIYLNKFSVGVVNPYVFTTLKNSILALFLLSLILVIGQAKAVKKLKAKDILKLVIVGLIGGAIPFLLFFKGLSLTSAAKGAFIHKTMFVWVAVLAVIFLKEKINKKLFLGILALLFGTYLVINITPSSLGRGDLLILLAVLLWSAEQVLSKHILKKHSAMLVACGRMFFGSIFLLLFLLFTGQLSLLSGLTASQFNWTIITALLLCGYVLTWYSGLKRLPASKATSILALGAPVTTILALVFDHKLISLGQIFGLGLILLGVFLVIDLKKTFNSQRKKVYAKPRS